MPSRSSKSKPEFLDRFPTTPGDRATTRTTTTTTLAAVPAGNPVARQEYISANQNFAGDGKNLLVQFPANCNQPVSVVHHHHHYVEHNGAPESQWDGCQVSDQISQVNGHRIFVNSRSVKECKINPIKGRHVFKNCTKKGRGVQVNGIEVIDVDGECQPTFPECAAEYLDCTFEAVPSNDPKVQGIQFNGGLFRHKGEGDKKWFD